MLSAQNLEITFNPGTPIETRALRGMSLNIPAGQFVTVIGSNGAGKSTFLNAISGDLGVDSGTITIDGMDVTRQPVWARASRVARVAAASGYEVVTLERGQTPTPDQLDADTAVALLFHDIDRELPMLDAALAAPVFYIGALGSRRTHVKRCEALRAHGHDDAALARIKAPIGIFDKARDSHALALSVVADIAAARLRLE